MKNRILIIFLILAKVSFSQNLIFTNQDLKNYLVSENCVDLNGDEFGDTALDINNDGEIQLSEVSDIQNLVLSTSDISITSIYDLHQFTSLKRLTLWGEFGLGEISNLNLDSLQHLRVSDHNSITDIDLSDLPALNSIYIEGLNGLNTLNIQNGSFASEAFSLFYTYFDFACVDDIAEEFDIVAMHLSNGGTPAINCSLGVGELINDRFKVYPNPVISELNIVTILKGYTASLSGVNGKNLYTQENANVIDMSDFKPGMYILTLISPDGGVINQKLIKE